MSALHGTTDAFIVAERVPALTGGRAAVWTWRDGLSWAQRELPPVGEKESGVLALAHDDGRYVAIGLAWAFGRDIPANGFTGCADLYNAESVAWTSLDGETWTLTDEAPPVSHYAAVTAAFTTRHIHAWLVGDTVLISTGGRQPRTWAPTELAKDEKGTGADGDWEIVSCTIDGVFEGAAAKPDVLVRWTGKERDYEGLSDLNDGIRTKVAFDHHFG